MVKQQKKKAKFMDEEEKAANPCFNPTQVWKAVQTITLTIQVSEMTY